jgi:mRNA interferase RelE/StbE
MDSCHIEFTRSALKDLRALDRQWVPRIITVIENLAHDPVPLACKKLAGSDHTYRIRIGDYRVVYEFHHTRLVVSIIRVRHRRDVYR